MRVLTDKPSKLHQRQGQALFNFLEWLQGAKNFRPNQNHRMADPFFIDDEEFDKLWEEWIKTMCVPTVAKQDT